MFNLKCCLFASDERILTLFMSCEVTVSVFLGFL